MIGEKRRNFGLRNQIGRRTIGFGSWKMLLRFLPFVRYIEDRMHRRLPRLLVFVLFLFPALSHAGGAIKTDILGFPLHWGADLSFNPDKGSLKEGRYDHAASVAIIQDAFDTWLGALGEGGSLAVAAGPEIPFGDTDVDVSNYSDFLGAGTEACYDGDSGTACVTPIIFDEDGEILDDLFGECSKFSILGFAGFDDITDGTGDPNLRIVKRGQALFSGACLADANGNTATKGGCGACKRALSEDEIRTIITHEVGHLMGMDHSQVNPDSFALCAGPDGCPAEVAQDITTMFPILVNRGAMLDLHRDDEAYFQRLYGATGDTCSVKGNVLARDGSTPVRGVEVVARNVDPALNKSDAISFVSGAESPRVNNTGKSQGNCKERCGEYFITGLAEGATYQLCAQRIIAQFTGGSSIEPVDPPFQAFTNVCPSGSTVTCSCPNGNCDDFQGMNLVTDADPNAIADQEEPSQIQDDVNMDSGGCSLAKPRTGIWQEIVRSR